MKVEINLNEQVNQGEHKTAQLTDQVPSCDVAIDIGQVLAANQALLKNMARKMENLESKLSNMETAFHDQARLLLAERNVTLMLTAPVKEVKPWEPKLPPLEPDHHKKFSLLDKLFRPWRMRRHEN